MLTKFALAGAVLAGAAHAQVTATGTMGNTNPAAPTMGSAINQTSMSRLLSVNSIDDFCIFAPPEPNSVIGNTEELEVAWCVQPRNGARVIPDGTLQAVHFVRTPLYVQVMGWGDFTKLNVQDGDAGGELDPHGATGLGNPVGGNVTSNVTGSDVNYEEWMNYMSFNQFCIRICTAENSTYSAALECQHTLDEMGCQWVMPGDYTNNSFTSCQADAAYPPGIYPLANGSTSTFAQRYTGTYTAGGSQALWTVGETVTPQTPFSTPASSQCTTYTSVGNGIALSSLGVSGTIARVTGVSGSSSSGSGSASATGSSSGSASGSVRQAAASGASSVSSAGAGAASSSRSGALTSYTGGNYGAIFAGSFSVVALLAGAGAVLL